MRKYTLGKEKGRLCKRSGSGVDIPDVSSVEIHPIKCSVMRRGHNSFLDVIRSMGASEGNAKRETVKFVGAKNDTGLDHIERILQVKIHNSKRNCVSTTQKTTIIPEGTVYKSDGKIMLHNKALPKDCYKVSIDKSLVDAAFIPDVGSNGCTIVLDAVGGFVAWAKDQVATPPSTIQMITVENKNTPKVPTKRKTFYVSSDAMQKEANKKKSQKSVVELEYHLEEVFKATNDQLDWHNPEGRPYPHDLSKPLPLIPDARGRQIIPYDHFINNDLEYLKGGSSSRKYTTSITKTKAADYGHVKWIEDKIPRSTWSEVQVVYDKHAYWGTYHWGLKRQRFYGYDTNLETSEDVYSKHRFIAVTSLNIMEFFGYKHLEEITVRRQDDVLYKF
ncbi:hypothetical protein Tco_0040289 [Tanacetum coccineum]